LYTQFFISPWSRVLLDKLTSSQSRNFPHFMEPKGSLPSSPVPATCPYPESARSSPYPNISWRSILILSSHLRLGLPSGLFPSGIPTNILYTPLLSPYVLHVPSISFFSILSPKKYWVGKIFKLLNNNNNNNNNNNYYYWQKYLYSINYCLLKLIYILSSKCTWQTWRLTDL